jgi:hypothetical protein
MTARKKRAVTMHPADKEQRGSGYRPAVRSAKRLRLPRAADATVTSLTLPRALHERAMIAALRLNWSFAELARVALGAWLDAHEPCPAEGTR